MRTLDLLSLVQIVCLSAAQARFLLDGCGQGIRNIGGKRHLSDFNSFAVGSFGNAGFGGYPPIYLPLHQQPTASISKSFDNHKNFEQFPGFDNFKTLDSFKGFGGIKPFESLTSTGKTEVFPPAKAEAYKSVEIEDGLGNKQGYRLHENPDSDHRFEELHNLEETHKHESLHKHEDYHKHNSGHKHQHKHHEQHKHQHKEEHKHGHKHKEEHKHGHHHKQVHHHKHEDVEHHHHEHKHVQHHHHQHKHVGDHQHKHKEEHKHGHKHHEDHHHGHKHLEHHHEDHKHAHKHSQEHMHGHKHEEEHKHLEEHHHGHKHGHKHHEKHDHGHKHGHKHHESFDHDGGYQEYQYRYLGKNKSPYYNEDLQEDRSNQQYTTAYGPPKRSYENIDSDQQSSVGPSDLLHQQSRAVPVANLEPQEPLEAPQLDTLDRKSRFLQPERLYGGLISS